MKYSSSLNNNNKPLVLDASVLINLNASGLAGTILSLLGVNILTPRITAEELKIDRTNGRNDEQKLADLNSESPLSIIDLESSAYNIYEQLVSGYDSASLGDGEAAVIALASESSAIPVIDDRKATRICLDILPHIKVASSVDIFSCNRVKSSICKEELSSAVYRTLKDARMSVREDQRQWIIDLIGIERARECHSLPRYKEM